MTDQAQEKVPYQWLENLFDGLRMRFKETNDASIVMPVLYVLLGAVLASLIFMMLGNFYVRDWEPAPNWLIQLFRWADGFGQNLGTEMFGAGLTFILIEVLLDQKRRNEADELEKKRLILQMGSPDNAFAVEAARQLRARGWVRDGSLQGAKLYGANLQGALLFGAKLERASLIGANLEGAHLSVAKLEGADLREAKLEGTDLFQAKLERASLWDANLEGAHLGSANLEGAYLRGANLQGAVLLTADQLRSAKTLKGATLPDGHKLPDDNDTWQAAFEYWVENTAQLKMIDLFEHTFIVPTRTDANAKWWDEYYGDGE